MTSNAPTECILYSTTMSLSTITLAVRSLLEKYKNKYQKLKVKDTYAAKVTEKNSLKGELRKYQIAVRTLRQGFLSTLEGTLVAGGEKRANGMKLIFSIMTSSNHFARTNSYQITSSLGQNS